MPLRRLKVGGWVWLKDGGWRVTGGLISFSFPLWRIGSLRCCISSSPSLSFLLIHRLFFHHLVFSTSIYLSIYLFYFISNISYLFNLYLTWNFSMGSCSLCFAMILLAFVSESLLPPIVSTLLPSCLRLQHMVWDVWVGAGTYWQLPGNRLVHHFIMAQSP